MRMCFKHTVFSMLLECRKIRVYFISIILDALFGACENHGPLPDKLS